MKRKLGVLLAGAVAAGSDVHAVAGVGPMPKLAAAQFLRDRRLLPGEILPTPEYGTKPFAEVVAPTIELADGVPYGYRSARAW